MEKATERLRAKIEGGVEILSIPIGRYLSKTAATRSKALFIPRSNFEYNVADAIKPAMQEAIPNSLVTVYLENGECIGKLKFDNHSQNTIKLEGPTWVKFRKDHKLVKGDQIIVLFFRETVSRDIGILIVPDDVIIQRRGVVKEEDGCIKKSRKRKLDPHT